MLLFVGCLTCQQHASVSQTRCSKTYNNKEIMIRATDTCYRHSRRKITKNKQTPKRLILQLRMNQNIFSTSLFVSLSVYPFPLSLFKDPPPLPPPKKKNKLPQKTRQATKKNKQTKKKTKPKKKQNKKTNPPTTNQTRAKPN